MDGAGGDVERLAGRVVALDAVDDRADGPFEHLEVLVLPGVVVGRWERAGLGVGGLHFQQLIVEPDDAQPVAVLPLDHLPGMCHTPTLTVLVFRLYWTRGFS